MFETRSLATSFFTSSFYLVVVLVLIMISIFLYISQLHLLSRANPHKVNAIEGTHNQVVVACWNDDITSTIRLTSMPKLALSEWQAQTPL